MNDGPELDRLEEALNAVAHRTTEMRNELKEEGAKRDRRIRLHRIAIAAAFVVGGLGIIVGAFGMLAVRDANQRLTDTRIAACKQYNNEQRVAVTAEKAESHDLIEVLAGSAKQMGTPNVDLLVSQYNKTHDRLIMDAHPLRDCSNAGIAKYLASN